jgi:hypothetical protein
LFVEIQIFELAKIFDSMFWIFKIAIQISQIVDIDGILNKDKTF